MIIKLFVHTPEKRAELNTLLDCGATENFLDFKAVKRLNLPIKRLPYARPVFNVDGSKNKSGDIKYYTDMTLQTGDKTHTFRFFLTSLGEQTAILGYPWFAAINPKITWAKGWLDEQHLPLILKPVNTQYYRITKARKCQQQCIQQTKTEELAGVPKQYHQFAKVFSDKESQRLPANKEWDHTIDLKPDVPRALPLKTYPLAQGQQKILDKFLKEQLDKGYIRPSKSPYAAPFFFIEKKNTSVL